MLISFKEIIELKELIETYGVGNWSLIASKMRGRTDSSVGYYYPILTLVFNIHIYPRIIRKKRGKGQEKIHTSV